MLRQSLLYLALSCVVILAACVPPSAAPTATKSVAVTARPTLTPTASLLPSPALNSSSPNTPQAQLTRDGRSNTLLIHDAHLHYSADSSSAYTGDQVIAILDGAGIQRALVSSTPNEGTILLYERFPERVVPSLRPYRTRADMSTWYNDATVMDFAEKELARGIYRAIGEFHVSGDDATTPVVKGVVELAVAHHMPLHAHSDAAAIASLFAHNSEVRVIWAHAGMSAPVDTLGEMIERYPNLWIELSLRRDIAFGDEIDPAWRDLFVRHPDRFLYGTDTWVKDRWQQLPDLAVWARGWLADIPPDVAVKIATRNFEALFPEE